MTTPDKMLVKIQLTSDQENMQAWRDKFLALKRHFYVKTNAGAAKLACNNYMHLVKQSSNRREHLQAIDSILHSPLTDSARMAAVRSVIEDYKKLTKERLHKS